MAKAKKPTGSPSKSKKPAAPAKPAPASAPPLIDTSLVANAAARMIAARNAQPAPAAPPSAAASPAEKQHESAAFKQLKEGLAKPTPALGPSMAPVSGQSKSTLPHTFAKQVGRNQTFGADVNRSGVPRRTGG